MAVEPMAHGHSPTEAATLAVTAIAQKYPNFKGALIVLKNDGQYGVYIESDIYFLFMSSVVILRNKHFCFGLLGAACHGYTDFNFRVRKTGDEQARDENVLCFELDE